MRLDELTERVAAGEVPVVDYGDVVRRGRRRRRFTRGLQASGVVLVLGVVASSLPSAPPFRIDPVTPIFEPSPDAVPSIDDTVPPAIEAAPETAPPVAEPPPPGGQPGPVDAQPDAGPSEPPTSPAPPLPRPDAAGTWVWTGPAEGAMTAQSSVRIGTVAGDERVLAADGRMARISPDGRRVAFADDRGVNVVGTDGSGLRRLVDVGPAARNLDLLVQSLAWSPDGTHVAYHVPPCVSACAAPDARGTFVVDANAANPTPVRLDADGEYPTWSPDSRRVAFQSGWDLAATTREGTGRQVLWDQGPVPTYVARFPAWSPDGRHIAVVVGPEGYSPSGRMTMGIRIVDVERRAVVASAEGPDGFMFREGGPEWSPDGSRLAWSAFTDDSGPDAAVFVADPLLAQVRIVGLGGGPVWSPDGAWLLVATYGGEEQEQPRLRALEVSGDRVVETQRRGFGGGWSR